MKKHYVITALVSLLCATVNTESIASTQNPDVTKITMYANCIASNLSPTAAHSLLIMKESKHSTSLKSAMNNCAKPAIKKTEVNFSLIEKLIYFESAILHEKVRNNSDFKNGIDAGLCIISKIPPQEAKDIYNKKRKHPAERVEFLVNSCTKSKTITATDTQLMTSVLSSYLIKAGNTK
jgi:hypothetical protein